MLKKRRIGAWVLAAVLFSALVLGCGGCAQPDDDKPDDTTTAGKELEGYTFTLVSAYMHSYMSENPTEQEVLFFKRKEQVEQMYGCKIKIKNLYCEQSVLLPKILAGDTVGDVIELMPSMWIPAISSGCIVPWDDIEGIDVYDESRWVQAYTNASVVDGKCYGIQYATPPEVRTCMLVNKTLLASKGFTTDLAELVNSKEWTFEKFRELCKLVTEDSDSDGNLDTYGLLNWQAGLTAYALALANNGGLLKENNGDLTNMLNSSQNTYALNFLDTLVNTDKVVKLWDNMREEKTWNSMPSDIEIIDEFRSGRAGFMITDSWMINQYLKGKVSFDYAMIPLPMGPDATEYVSPAQNMRVFCMTSTMAQSENVDKAVKVFNALAQPPVGYEGTDWWMEDIQTEYFQNNDTSSAKMYDLCLNASTVDLGIGVPDMLAGFEWSAVSSIYWQHNTAAAQLESIANNYRDPIASIFKFLEDD